MGNFSVLWEEHKKFIIGVLASVLVVGIFFLAFVRPTAKEAQATAKKAAKEKEKLTTLFQGEEIPTPGLKREYRKMQDALGTREEEILADVAYAVESPFLLPQGETQPGVYFSTIHDRTREEVRNMADLSAIELMDQDLGFDKTPSAKDSAEALAVLSMIRTASLAAIEAGVSAIVKILLRTGKERSVQLHDRRIEENIIQMEVRGETDAILRFLKNLQRRGAFLLVLGCDISRIKDDNRVRGVVDFAALSVRTVEKTDEDEEDDKGGDRRW